MKVEGFLFSFLSLFFLGTAVVYWLVSRDDTGFTCLLLSAGMTFIIGVFALLIAVSGLLFEYYVGINRTQSFTLSNIEAIGELPTLNRKFIGEEPHQ